MKSKAGPRRYSSPLRDAQAEETRGRILAALAEIVELTGEIDVGFDEIAKRAGVERRTVFRHFEDRTALLRAFWVWMNERISQQVLPKNQDELISFPRAVFEGFDRNEGLVRASLHSESGREMRRAAIPARREAIAASLSGLQAGMDPATFKKVEALAHVLYSAATWEILRDYCGMSGSDAGETVSWGLRNLIKVVGALEKKPSKIRKVALK
ncbi:TetR/AcrR family transcriptional regulator [Nibricoccus sp. IMCC34717]|uniref:TetR/AcrR family transcriptional regulator n=1 Tax=Nibricoccus sp. IMCC34717 TaxID=3034021 RepID=UPI00384D926E